MSAFKKSFVPDNPDQTGTGIRSTVKTSLLDIILKLAEVSGFNNQHQIKDRSGSFVPGTNVGLLVTYAVTPEKLLYGKKQFADLLVSAGVKPESVANENLRKHMKSGSFRPQTPPPSPTPPSAPPAASEPQVVMDAMPPPPPLRYMGGEVTQAFTPRARARPRERRPEERSLPTEKMREGNKRKSTEDEGPEPKKVIYESFDNDSE